MLTLWFAHGHGKFWPVNGKVDLTIKRSDTSLLEPTVKTQKKVLDTVLEDREDIDYYEGMNEKKTSVTIVRVAWTIHLVLNTQPRGLSWNIDRLV